MMGSNLLENAALFRRDTATSQSCLDLIFPGRRCRGISAGMGAGGGS